MFVSDGLVCLVAGTYRHGMELIDRYTRRLTAEQREGIFGGNAIACYRLTA